MNTFKFICLFWLCSLNIAFAQNDCTDAIVVCGNSGFSGLEANGIGIQELFENNSCSAQENNSIWLKLRLKTAGTLGFILTPESTDIEEDFDFFIFGPAVNCGNLGTAIRCSTTNPSMANLSDNLTGMNATETDVSEGPGDHGSSFVQWLTVSAGDVYYIAIDLPIGFSNFSLQWTGTATFDDLPVIQPTNSTASIDMEKCSQTGPFTSFDLTQNNAIIIGAQTGLQLTYHLSTNDAALGHDPIPTPSSFTNTANPQKIIARLSNPVTGCFSTKEFTIKTTYIDIPRNVFSLCDDGADGNGNNARTVITFNEVTDAVFGTQDRTGLTFRYFDSATNANNNLAPLGPSIYNTTPGSQTVFLRVSNATGCFKVRQIDISVLTKPAVINTTIVQCDTESTPDGITMFRLSEMVAVYSNNDPNLSVAFFETGSTTPLGAVYTNTTNPQVLHVKTTNLTTGCFSWSNLTLRANVNPQPPLQIASKCDTMDNETGLQTFDLNTSNLILNPTQTAAFYSNPNDAVLEQNAITTLSNYPNPTPYLSVVYVRINDASGCAAIRELPLIVNKLPEVTREENGNFVCIQNPDYKINLNAAILSGAISDYDYEWFLNNLPLSENTYEIEVSNPGIYIVKVTSRNTGCTVERKIEVINSEFPTINTIIIDDFITENNTVTVNINPSINGYYVYALDFKNGSYQESNIFTNVKPGIHDLYIKDENACGIFGPVQLTVLGIPGYFTPNNDGYNDKWTLQGASINYNSKATIMIFNKFGKLMKQVGAAGDGWDGTYNNKLAPAEDYWYIITLEDGRSVKGHFALKR